MLVYKIEKQLFSFYSNFIVVLLITQKVLEIVNITLDYTKTIQNNKLKNNKLLYNENTFKISTIPVISQNV